MDELFATVKVGVKSGQLVTWGSGDVRAQVVEDGPTKDQITVKLLSDCGNFAAGYVSPISRANIRLLD
jgi:hypothetical protein